MKDQVKKLIPLGAVLVAVFFVMTYVLELDAYARAGGGRSSGSRGSHSSVSPSKPAPSQSLTSPAPSRSVAPAAPTPAPQSGGFLRSMAGGIMGGLLGGMLFSSLGFGHGGGFGGGGGGIGLMDIIILGALLYFIYWFIKRRKATNEAEATGTYYQSSGPQPVQPAAYAPVYEVQDTDAEKNRGIGYIKQMDPAFDESRFTDLCMDIFFKIQGAWGARDLSTARSVLTDEMYGILQTDADKMKQERKVNKLENIAVRTVEITEAWQESGKDFITVRLLANLLDYTVSDSGELLAGSKTEPVKFEEYWTFVRPVGNNPWQLSGIDQA
jgi:predicted lipid-binding transport protein (Tim44 family)